MEINTVEVGGVKIAAVKGEGKLLCDERSALDIIASVNYITGCDRMTIAKSSVADDFFVLSTRLAGDILQKFINYHMKLAIYGDYSGYKSKPLHDFIYESNRGKDIFFTATEKEAELKLSGI
jgi:hypothetical protein